MKCIKYSENCIVRVKNDEAAEAVRCGFAHYISRREWKQKVRDAKKE